MKKKMIIGMITLSSLLISVKIQAQKIMKFKILPVKEITVDSIRTDGSETRGYRDGKVVAFKTKAAGVYCEEAKREGLGTISAIKDSEGIDLTLTPNNLQTDSRFRKNDTTIVIGGAVYELASKEGGSYPMLSNPKTR